jgi:hypothetical protein
LTFLRIEQFQIGCRVEKKKNIEVTVFYGNYQPKKGEKLKDYSFDETRERRK